MVDEASLRHAIEASLQMLDRDLIEYETLCRRLGEPVSRLTALDQFEELVLRPEEVAKRAAQARKAGVDPEFVETALRESIHRLRMRARS